MSDKFTGVTFANQKVTPSNDAVVRRAIFNDGILSGCALSYSGATLTMAAGQIMLCGRQLLHPSSQNWAVDEATSGYARLILTIDLSRTSTKETFDQVVDTIEYATALNGFAALEQEDINVDGTRYSQVICVVSLGSGGITGIVSRLGSGGITGFVPISGGTMTGVLKAPGYRNTDTSTSTVGYYFWPNGTKNNIGSFGMDVANRRLRLVQYAKDMDEAASAYGEVYVLPSADSGRTKWTTYNILTSKTVTYGTAAPETAVGAAGTAGRIYFKKVT